jgi:hypothetical protein
MNIDNDEGRQGGAETLGSEFLRYKDNDPLLRVRWHASNFVARRFDETEDHSR